MTKPVFNIVDGTTFEFSLVGKWIQVNPNWNMYSNGEIPVYVFTEEELHYYNFDTYSRSVLYHRHENELCIPEACYQYLFYYRDRFCLFFHDLFDPFYPIREDFLRILPTESDISFEELATKTLYAPYESFDLDEVIELQPPYPKDGTKRLDGSYDEKEIVYRLEAIDDCWIITKYYDGYRHVCYPIWYIEDQSVHILGVETEETLADTLTYETDE
ncbi:MAG: hypothetical protein OIF50_14935 [Flavobacteriaceae bacterium]|nr:hypothetical protein [Flavobacteriaceae bacterium]